MMTVLERYHLEPGPLVLLAVHHELEGVAALPEVLGEPAHHGHQVGAVLPLPPGQHGGAHVAGQGAHRASRAHHAGVQTLHKTK